jgi:hypothetical protein
MADAYLLPRIGSAVEILADLIVEPDPALLNKQHDAGGDELFADRADLEDGFGAHGHIELDIGESVYPAALVVLPAFMTASSSPGM